MLQNERLTRFWESRKFRVSGEQSDGKVTEWLECHLVEGSHQRHFAGVTR
jgi:hypothetical protein